MNESAQRIGRQLKIPGYRPGKVPLKVVVAHVGEQEVKEDAMERLTQQVVGEAIQAEDLHPVAPTSVELVSEDPLTYKAVVPLRPEVDLGDYMELRVEPPETEAIEDEQVDEIIETWRRDMAFLAPVDRPAEEGDVLTVSLAGRHGENSVFEEDEFNLPLNAEGAQAANLPPEVSEQLIGISSDESREFGITYSEFWPQAELQNQVVDFEATAVRVAAITLPDLDDSLAQEIGDVETLDELRERVRQQTELRAQIESREQYVEAALDALVEGATVTYPPALLEAETAEVVADLRNRIERQGFTWERWLELQNTDIDKLWDEMEQQAEKRLLRGLVLNELVQQEGIDLTEDEVEAEVDRLTDLLPAGTSKKALPSRDQVKRSASNRMLTNRALERLLEIVSEGAEAGPDGAALDEGTAQDNDAADAAATAVDDTQDAAVTDDATDSETTSTD
jgi:trigger factor